MDHVPEPETPIRGLFEVPCYTTEPYDGGDFETYPERLGWASKTTEEWHAIFRTPSQEFKAFLQCWLFFGIMETTLGERIPLTQFTKTLENPTRIVVTTESLPMKLHLWRTSGGNYLRGDQDGYLRALRKIYVATSVIQALHGDKPAYSDYKALTHPGARMGLQTFLYNNNFKDPRSPAFSLSLALVVEAITITVSELLYTDAAFPGSATTIRGLIDGAGSIHAIVPELNFTYRLLRENGWCPSHLHNLFARLGVAALAFLTQLDRPPSPREHNMIQITKMNEERLPLQREKLCHKYSCAVWKMDESAYKQVHAHENCSCPFLSANDVQILNILDADSIPLIQCVDERDGDAQLKLTASKPGDRYVAISHVWSDGLGNQEESAILTCQLHRLSRLVRDIGYDLFWLDTIGCPPDSAHQDQAQTLALAQMAATYRNARAVLVLDSWLLSTRIRGGSMDDREVLLRILCSHWNSRLWTFQEGALAARLLFQFADAAYDLFEGSERFQKNTAVTNHAMRLCLGPTIQDRVDDLRAFRAPDTHQADRIQAASNALQFRSTSVAEDEAICLANLLELDVREVLNGPGQTRMERLWAQVLEVPDSFTYRDWPRLEGAGAMHWAPAGLLRSPRNKSDTTVSIESRQTAPPAVTKDGLFFRYTGYVFQIHRCPLGPFFHFKDTEGRFRVVNAITENAKGAVEYYDCLDSTGVPRKLYKVDPWGWYGCDEVAWIETGGDHTSRGHIHDYGMGFLVAVMKRLGGVIYARYLCRAQWDLYKDGQHDFNLESLRDWELWMPEYGTYPLSGTLMYTRARNLPDRQRWCMM